MGTSRPRWEAAGRQVRFASVSPNGKRAVFEAVVGRRARIVSVEADEASAQIGRASCPITSLLTAIATITAVSGTSMARYWPPVSIVPWT